ncbi:uncharacterized protein LOC144747062 [Ciona intestinalis]
MEEIANQIRKFCNKQGGEVNEKESAKLLHKLALELKKSKDKISLIQAATLMNAAILRQPDNIETVEQDLQQLCKDVLKEASVKHQSVDLVKKANRFKRQLNLMRSEARDKLDSVLKKIGPDSCLSQVKRQNVETREMVELQTWITEQYTNIMQDISKCCVEISGTEPCSFALVGMGSLARKEITPYSDFENVIVLKEGVQKLNDFEKTLEYFRWFAVIFQIILINFGETIIPSVAIPCLNNFEVEGGDWFYDAITPSGISFDGFMPHACKTILGRYKPTNNKDWTTELIKPVSHMLNYLTEKQDLKNGYHLADVLTTTCFVHGDEKVYKEFADGAAAKRKAKFQGKSKVAAKHMEDLRKDFRKYDVSENLVTGSDTPKYNLKQGAYRLTTLFISEIGMKHDVSETSSFMVVEKLYEKGVISLKQRDQFSYAVAIACRLRLMVYMNEQCQKDMMKHSVHETRDAEKLNMIQMLGEDSAINYFVIADTLQQFVAKELNINLDDLFDHVHDEQDMQIQVCFYLKLYDRVCHIYETVFEPQLTSDKVITIGFIKSMEHYAHTLLRIKKNLESVKVYRQILQLLESQPNHRRLPYMKFKAMNNLAVGLADLHKHEEELEYHLKAYDWICQCEESNTYVQDIERKKARSAGNVADSYFRLDQFASALEYIKIKLKLTSHQSPDPNNDKGVALCYNNKAVCNFQLRRFEEALQQFSEALVILEAFESIENTTKFNQPVFQRTLCSIRFNTESKEHTVEDKYVKLRLTELHSDITNTRDKAAFLTNKAVCLFRLGRFEESYELHKKVLEMRTEYFVDTKYAAEIEESEVNVASCDEMLKSGGCSPTKKRKI